MPLIHFLKIHLNIILPSTPGSSKWFLSISFFPPKLCIHSCSPQLCYMPRPSHSSRFHHWNNIWWGEQIIKLFTMYFSPLPVTSSLLGSLAPLFLNTLSPRTSRNVSDQVSHPYKTIGNIIVLYILIFIFLDSRLEGKRLCTKWCKNYPDFNLLLTL